MRGNRQANPHGVGARYRPLLPGLVLDDSRKGVRALAVGGRHHVGEAAGVEQDEGNCAPLHGHRLVGQVRADVDKSLRQGLHHLSEVAVSSTDTITSARPPGSTVPVGKLRTGLFPWAWAVPFGDSAAAAIDMIAAMMTAVRAHMVFRTVRTSVVYPAK